MTPIPELNDLVDTVTDRCPSGSALDKLRAASRVNLEVGRIGEDLVTHYVDQARSEGASWADIGDVLGVSRQGAHQRHQGRGHPERWWRADFGRFTPRARQAVKAALEEARGAGNSFIGSEHLLLGLLRVPGNVGNLALERCGADLAALEDATHDRLVPPGEEPAEEVGRPFGRRRGGRLPFTASGRRTFDLATGVALELGHNYLGCEHLLIALARGEGVAAEVLAAAEIRDATLVDAVRTILVEKLTAKQSDG